METLTGYIIDLTEEKKGPVKYYKRFTIITTENQNIQGWVFSSSPLEQTATGKSLSEAAKTQTSVTIKGKIIAEPGDKRTMKIFVTNKFDQFIHALRTNDKLPDNAVVNVSIGDALSSEGLCRISIKSLNENSIVNYEQDDKEHKYKTCIIADNSSTTILIVYDHLIESIEPNKNYILTNINTKKIFDTIILTTTSNTTVSESTTDIDINLEDLDATMNINLNDIVTLSTTINEIGDIIKENSCSICRQNMIPVVSKQNLFKCITCKKTVAAKKDNIQTNITIEIDGTKMIFWTKKGLLFDFITQQRPDLEINSEDIQEILLLGGPWKITISIFRRQVLAIFKE